MAIDELRKWIVATPFQPFTINIADGRRIPVTGRDFILIPSGKGRMVVVYQLNGEYDFIDAMLITGVSFQTIPDPSSIT